MIYKEVREDLLSFAPDYYLVHCIGADFEIPQTSGVSNVLNNKYNIVSTLRQRHGHDILKQWDANPTGTCLLEKNIFNLIIKRTFAGKPTYDILRNALISMRHIMEAQGITKIAMPKIGAAKDGLSWPEVVKIIEEVFNDTDFEIVVRSYKPNEEPLHTSPKDNYKSRINQTDFAELNLMKEGKRFESDYDRFKRK